MKTNRKIETHIIPGDITKNKKHSKAVSEYLRVSFLAASAITNEGQLMPLEDIHKQAYKKLPDLIKLCTEEYNALAEVNRSIHPLIQKVIL